MGWDDKTGDGLMLTELTQEQIELMHKVREEWLNRFYSLDFDEKKAIELMDFVYSLVGRKAKYKFILDSPLALQFSCNIFSKMSKVWWEMESEVEDEVGSKVRREVGSKVSGEVESEVEDEVGSKVMSKASEEVESEVEDEVRSEVWSEVRSKVWSKVWSKVRSKVWSKVGSKVSGEVLSKVWSEVRSEVMSKASEEVEDEVGSKVRSEVRSKVSGEVRSKVWSEVRSEVSGEVRSKVWSEVSGEVMSKASEEVESEKINGLTYYNESTYCRIDDFYWVAYYDFFERIGIINNPLFTKYKELIKGGLFTSIMQNDYYIICRPPVFLKVNDKGQMDCATDYAIAFADGYKQAYVKGIYIPSEIFEKHLKNKLSFKDIMNIENMEQRYAIMSVYDKEKLFMESGAVLISETDHGNKLYSMKDLPLKLLRYSCPSTGREYFKWVNARFNDADEAQLFYHRRSIENGYSMLISES